jgi:hypothetical protein
VNRGATGATYCSLEIEETSANWHRTRNIQLCEILIDNIVLNEKVSFELQEQK